MAISDDFTIDPVTKKITHSGGTTVYTTNQLYSYTTTYFDDQDLMDDTVPMSAQTPTSFTLENSWYIDETSIHFLKTGSLKTSGWDATTNNNGVRIFVLRSSGYVSAVPGDLGREVGYSGGSPSDTGTLLAYDNTLRKWWVRTDDTGDTFANTATNLDLDNGSGTGAGRLNVASVTGENIWTDLYTLGTIADNTQIYLYQNDAQITPWWVTGHIDVLVLVKESSALIDFGYVTIYARQYGKLYDHYVAGLGSGNQTPIPLATFSDSNNPTGYRTFTGSSGSGTFQVGEIISYSTTTFGIVTAVAGSVPSPVLTYYLYRYPLTDFSNGNAVTGAGSSAACTAGTSAAAGPAGYSGITLTFSGTSQDLNNSNGARPYDVFINCNTYLLSQVYEYLKYLTRYGSAASVNGHNGEDYVAVGDIRLSYVSQSANFTEGLVVTGGSSGAQGTIVADHDSGTSGTLILRDVNGTFSNNEALHDASTGAATSASSNAVETISPTKQAPFGTYAGGKFFGARGVFLSNMGAADANNYELVDSAGVRQVPPIAITITVNGIVAGDEVAIFQSTGAGLTSVNKSQYNVQASQSLGVAYVRVTQSIPNDTPATGFIRVVRRDGSGGTGDILGEERYAYTSWNNTNQPTYSTFVIAATILTYGTTDTAYVGYIDDAASGTSLAVAFVYVSDRTTVIRLRRSGILPYEVPGSITNTNQTITPVRVTDNMA